MFTDNPILIQEQDIEAWVRKMFGSTYTSESGGVRLVVKVNGQTVSAGSSAAVGADEDTRAALKELTESFEQHTGQAVPGDTVVQPPSRATIARALRVLSEPSVREKALAAALSIFGRRVVAPLDRVLGSAEDAPVARLLSWRGRLHREIQELRLSPATASALRADLDALLTDEYLAALGERDDKVLRPQLQELAQRVLNLLAEVFHFALEEISAHHERLADQMAAQLPSSTPLRDVPPLLKAGFVGAVTAFLTGKTRAQLSTALLAVSSEYDDVMADRPPLRIDAEWYRDLALAYWDIVSTHS